MYPARITQLISRPPATALVIGVALVLSSLPSHALVAQAAPTGLVLGELYREARARSPRVDAARALARAARARVAPAKRPPDPQVQLGFMNYSLPDLRPMDPLGMTQLQLMQMVPIPGKLGLSGRAAAAQASAAVERASDAEWTIRSEVAAAFYDLYQADQGLAVGRQTLRLLEDIRRTAESMYRVGEGRQADVLRAQVEIARMAEDTIRMTTMRTGMAAKLTALLDRPLADSLPSPVPPAFPDTVPALQALVAVADTGRPMVKAGQREADAADARVKLARREIWPDLAIGLQYGQRGGEMGTERMGSLMIGTSIPIFAGSRQAQMREEATAMRQMAAADLAAMRADTRARVADAYASLVRARNLGALYRTTVLPQAEATVASALAAYRVGQVDFMTLLDDRMTVNRYRQELAALDADQGKAWAELEMLTGRELIDADARGAAAATPPANAPAPRGPANGARSEVPHE